LLIHAGAFNLGLVMRKISGCGTPRGFQGDLNAFLIFIPLLWKVSVNAIPRQWPLSEPQARKMADDKVLPKYFKGTHAA
jgi:transposase